ncbi:MAG TPA: DmsE family decaheme c-type cytochrome [Terracidiphilus sp.]|nr:DmsE family decaheme c-type cytochrome [Terracidiphilus sp.]
MRRVGSVSSLRTDAVLFGVSVLRAGLLSFLGVMFLCAPAVAAPAGRAGPSGDQKASAAPSEDASTETCATCHEDVVRNFSTNPHARISMMRSGPAVTCEACHGPGKAHVESGGDKSKIIDLATAPVQAVDQKCLTCHQGNHENFERSAHGEANVGCISCHSVHAAGDAGHLLKAEEPKLCFQCHTDVKPQFAMPFHHKVEEGLLRCSDCHDPHGTFDTKLLRSSAQQDAVCTKCHTETAGPFVYEHPVVRAEGCTACHTPHGGPNPRLLKQANVNTLCLQCHTPSPNFGTAGIPTFHTQSTQYQACTVCHTSIHGSNTSPIFFNSTE